MEKKRVFALLSSLIILSAIAVGCSNANNASNTEETPTIIWYVPGNKQDDMASVMEAANQISEKEIGARLDLQMIDTGSFEERMNMYMASRADFDLCFTGYINQYITCIKMGGFYGMSELLDKMPNLKNSIPDYAWKAVNVNDEIYAVPNLQVMAARPGVFILKQFADKYDFNKTEISNERELEPFYDKILANEKGVFPITSSDIKAEWRKKYETVLTLPHMVAELDDPTHKISWFPDLPEYQDMLKLKREWYVKGYIRPDIDSASTSALDLRSGKYASFTSNWKPGVEKELANRHGHEVVFVQTNETMLPNECGRDTMTAISATSKKPELAAKMIELVNINKDFYNTICFGIENKHYQYLEDGIHIKLIENSGYSQLASWKFGNQFNAVLLEGQDENVWVETKKMNDEARRSTLIGFIPDVSPIKNEIAQCSAVQAEYSILNSCSEDYTKYYEDYRIRMYDAGIQRIIDELNRQVAEWIAKQ